MDSICGSDENDRQELEKLKEQVRRLNARLLDLGQLSSEVAQISGQIAKLEARLNAAEAVSSKDIAPAVPPQIEATQAEAKLPIPEEITGEQVIAPPVWPDMAFPTVPTLLQAQAEVSPPETLAPPPVVERAPPREKSSFELRLGTYWLARIGIVLVLTGLVILATLAYKKWIIHTGPGGKVALLYAAGAVLLGVGGWLYHKYESLRNYAQVLVAGGLAEVFFTTYAAHHFTFLQIIHSPLLDAFLLLAWAAFIVALADWKKSELLALFAIVLSYYTAVITRVGLFTLYANLILAIAAMVFLFRNRWAGISIVSLFGTYTGYAFWRFFGLDGWHWGTPEAGLWAGAYFLGCYWCIFTAAVVLSKPEAFSERNRAGFLTLNNGALFGLFLLTMLQVHQHGLWKVALIFGAILLAVAALCRRLRPQELLTRNAYLVQGLLLVTLGFIAYFTGMNLALVLGIESVLLLLLSRTLQNRVLHFGSFVCAGLSTIWLLASLEAGEPTGIILGSAIGLMMLFNAWREERPEKEMLHSATVYFTVLAVVSWLDVTWKFTPTQYLAPTLGLEALLFTVSLKWLRLSELAVFGQGFLLLAQVQCAAGLLAEIVPLPWWNPVLVVALTIGISHWWQRPSESVLPKNLQSLLLGAYGLAAVAVLFSWLRLHFEPSAWLAVTSLLAVGLTAYGLFRRLWLLAAWGQFFLLVSIFEFFSQYDATPGAGRPPWLFALAPIAVLWGTALGVLTWWKHHRPQEGAIGQVLAGAGIGYRALAVLLALFWTFEYITPPNRVWVLIAAGGGFFLWNVWKPSREALVISAVFTLTGLSQFWRLWNDDVAAVYWPNLAAILFILVEQQIARRKKALLPQAEAAHAAVILLGGLSLWAYVSHLVRLQSGGGFYLTAAWAGLALVIFNCGFILRERTHRWLGLGILAAGLGRVIVFDVWELETVYRIFSFLALGVVLLVLGFIYNRYQEKIKLWL